MPVRLRWNLGPSGEGKLAHPPTPTILPTGARRLRLVALSLLYAAALAAAAWVGFALGRVNEARRINLAGIANQVAVERVAWQEGDAGLYASTLDPDASPAWRGAQVAAFTAAAPQRVGLEIGSIDLAERDSARVEVVFVAADHRHGEMRTYRASGRSWYQTETLEPSGSPGSSGSAGP